MFWNYCIKKNKMFRQRLLNQQLHWGLSLVVSDWIGGNGWWFSSVHPRIISFSVSPAVLSIDHKLSKALQTLKNMCWSMVAIQCCVIFRHTVKWICHKYINIYVYFLDSFPIQPLAEYWVEFPVLYSRSLLVICLHIVLYICQSQHKLLFQS